LFPEQAANWDWFSDLIKKANRPIKVLNLFAYTGGATLAAAKAGASVTHVDASKGMVNWAKENAASSGLADAPIRWLVDDCVKFVEREIRRGSTYDAIIMDPPSYGRGPKGEIWKIEDSIFPFIQLSAQILSPNPLFFLVNSYTTGLQPAVLSYMINIELTKKYGGIVTADEVGLPVKDSGLTLPCGASGRWSKE
jgi:23S rRNA (cytosine1962-C5)-methyltransferase